LTFSSSSNDSSVITRTQTDYSTICAELEINSLSEDVLVICEDSSNFYEWEVKDSYVSGMVTFRGPGI